MAEVLTVQDLEAAKKHDTFHGEVITGKAGAVASGADIETATSAVTGQIQATLPKILRDIGVMVQTWTATTGGTLTDASQVFLNDITTSSGKGNYYAWTGTFPKVVAPGADPAAIAGFVMRSDAALRQQINTDFPESFGAAGDGVTDDTASISSSISGTGASSYLRKGAKYLVTAISNALGKPLIGAGHVVKSVTGGLEAQNTYADHYQRVTGQENLAAWYRLVYDQHTAPSRSLRIAFSGDSTTEGVGVDPEYTISNLVSNGIISCGMQSPFGTICVNNGHSGQYTGQWEATHVHTDISAAPDLLVLRWGINDPGYLKDGSNPPLDSGQSYPNRRDITDFATSLRNGLTTFRAAKSFSTTSIILMMPNSTYDIPNGRDALWYEQMRDVLIQAARDFQCAFIDTYAIMQDSKHLANILMDDPMPTSGRGIHPNNAMNSIIAGHIVNLVSPEGMRHKLGSNIITSQSGNSFYPPVAWLPIGYPSAVSLTRALASQGWPLDGNALTFKTSDETSIQFNFGYTNADRGKLKFRQGRVTAIGGDPAGWSEFFDIGISGNVTHATPAPGYSLPASGKMRVAMQSTSACMEGHLNKTVPSVIPSGTTVGSIPAGMSPVIDAVYCVATVWDGTNFEQVPCSVYTTGDVVLLKATTLVVQRVYISCAYDRRGE